MNFVQNILWNSVEGFVEAGTRTAGGYAGDALIKAGDLIENGGRGVGGSIERAATGYSTKISGQPPSAGSKSKPRPGAARSNSSPASTKAGSRVPIGGKKYPGGNIGGGPQKQITSGAKSAVGGAQKSIGGAVGGAPKALGGAQKTAGASIQKGVGIVGSGAKSLPKPFPNSNSSSVPLGGSKTNAPKPNNASGYPSEKKTAVSAYKPKPFVPPQEQKKSEKSTGGKPSYPGAGGKTAVRAGQYKPMPRLAGTAERGKVEHIAV
ncbi:hypothetical protein BDV96DRAFT_605778 [Lophiotrema nucula]|uniref:Uncharacterized protein n=1 Tax=Lophiotrema nucula TaxID=690887 RepID=A0A6A5YMT3_9PLEO|nr:hypothetical protein BDV96DRAFT_605778 [Lophiotrema nucula]